MLLVFSVFSLVLYKMFVGDTSSTVESFGYTKAFNLAEAGKNYSIKRIASYADWSATMGFPISKSFNTGVFIVRSYNGTGDTVTIESTGITTIDGKTYARTMRFSASKSGGTLLGNYSLMSFGSGSGDMTLNLSNNCTVTGNIYAGCDIALANNVNITGSVYSVDDITSGANVNVSGTRESHVTASASPTVDVSYYQGLINTAATAPAGNLNFSGSTFSVSGTYYVNGNMIVANNATINTTGSGATFVVNGSVTMSNNVKLGNNLKIIAKNNITTANNFDIGNNGLLFSLLPTSDITFGNNADSGNIGVGTGTVIMTPGDVTISNNASIKGFIYAGGRLVGTNNCSLTGAIVAGFIDFVGNNATLNFSSSIIDYSSIIGLSSGLGPSGQIVITGWREVY